MPEAQRAAFFGHNAAANRGLYIDSTDTSSYHGGEVTATKVKRYSGIIRTRRSTFVGGELFEAIGFWLDAAVNGTDCTLQYVHDAWSAWMTVKHPDHDALVPFGDLSPQAQEKDRPYLVAIERAAVGDRLATNHAS